MITSLMFNVQRVSLRTHTHIRGAMLIVSLVAAIAIRRPANNRCDRGVIERRCTKCEEMQRGAATSALLFRAHN